ncbi:GTP-binding protein [Tulasnella sp. 330]|nr:GTP-binding protein [Tulasnella sp. 330]
MSVDHDRSSALPELVSFDGKEGEEVTDFLRNVKRVALAEGQLRNDQWLIDYTETCLAGPALKWFLGLENEDILGSWKGLQRALLRRFDSAQMVPSAPLPVPAPAASAASAPAGFRPISSVSSTAPLPSEVDHKSLRYLVLGVGKSCLLTRGLGQVWVPYMPPTTGVSYETRYTLVSEKQWEQNFWDASGSDQYKEFRRNFYKGVDYFWFVYDVTDRKSFENIRAWFACAHSLCPEYISARLIGNKVDLHDKRVVSQAEGEALATELGLTWAGETSAKTNKGVQKLLGSWTPVLTPLVNI